MGAIRESELRLSFNEAQSGFGDERRGFYETAD